jgi:hypothetical protein
MTEIRDLRDNDVLFMWNNIDAENNAVSNYKKALENHPDFSCDGKWAEDCRKAYDAQMEYYLDPANAPVAN